MAMLAPASARRIAAALPMPLLLEMSASIQVEQRHCLAKASHPAPVIITFAVDILLEGLKRCCGRSPGVVMERECGALQTVLNEQLASVEMVTGLQVDRVKCLHDLVSCSSGCSSGLLARRSACRLLRTHRVENSAVCWRYTQRTATPCSSSESSSASTGELVARMSRVRERVPSGGTSSFRAVSCILAHQSVYLVHSQCLLLTSTCLCNPPESFYPIITSIESSITNAKDGSFHSYCSANERPRQWTCQRQG